MNTKEDSQLKTVSFKASIAEKIDLQQRANEKNISPSEFVRSLVYAFKDHYDYIGKPFPREEKLIEQLKFERREVTKLKLAIENADNRVDIEQKNNRKLYQQQLNSQQEIFNLNKKLREKQEEINHLNSILTQRSQKDASIKKTNAKEILSGSAIGFGLMLLLGGVFKR